MMFDAYVLFNSNKKIHGISIIFLAPKKMGWCSKPFNDGYSDT